MVVRAATWAAITALNGIALGSAFHWGLVFTTMFILAWCYAVAFLLLQRGPRWLVAACVGVVLQLLLSIQWYLNPTLRPLIPDIVAAAIVEWFVVGSVAGLVTMLYGHWRDGVLSAQSPKPGSRR